MNVKRLVHMRLVGHVSVQRTIGKNVKNVVRKSKGHARKLVIMMLTIVNRIFNVVCM